ncbi:hypothetical protein [Mesoterricola silvestris]|nr:hypothetical protein [Mesoterricola silvestris]
MFTHPLQATAPSAFPAAAASKPTSGFASVLAAATAAPDPSDEEKALQELFHILACLSCGVVDYPAETKAGSSTPGPYRREVEALKEVLRRIMTGNAGQPGKKGSGDDPADLSLQELYESLPPEVRNLLMRAFPKLQDMLRAASGEGTSSSS